VTDVGQGSVLLLVHTGFWSFIWRDVMQRLAPEFRCICLDAPGTGQSARLPSRAISLRAASRAVSTVVETLDLQDLTLVIHDLGGPAGLAGVTRTPERVRGIVAVNAFGWRPSGAVFRGMLRLMGSTAVREFDAVTEFMPRITATAFGAARRMDADSRRALRAGIGRQGIRAFHSYMRDALKCDDLYEQIEDALAGPLHNVPALTIFGEYNDPLGFQPLWKRRFPDADQVIVRRGNHFPMCDDPNLVASTIRSWHRDHIKL
jgi:haloalkane dehalogenase